MYDCSDLVSIKLLNCPEFSLNFSVPRVCNLQPPALFSRFHHPWICVRARDRALLEASGELESRIAEAESQWVW